MKSCSGGATDMTPSTFTSTAGCWWSGHALSGEAGTALPPWSSRVNAAPYHAAPTSESSVVSFGGGKQKWKGSRTLGKSQGRQLHSEGELAMPVSTHLPVLWMQVSFIKTLFVV